jgi:hypothetical protein
VVLICKKGYYPQQELQMPVFGVFTNNNVVILIPTIFAKYTQEKVA